MVASTDTPHPMSRGGSIASSVFEFPRAAPSTARRPNKRVPAPSASQASPPARQRERTAGHPTGPGGPTSSDATEERTTREEGAEVYMAVVLAGRRLGVAVYDADAGTLQVWHRISGMMSASSARLVRLADGRLRSHGHALG